MTVYLVRHAKAGERAAWEGDDRTRPLTRRGRLQAEAIARSLLDAPIGGILSSPAVRCIETVVPLASARTLTIEVTPALAEGASLDEAMSLVRKWSDAGAVLCSHGDVVPLVLGHLGAAGVPIEGEPAWPKGSIWVLETRAGDVVRARYVPPDDASD